MVSPFYSRLALSTAIGLCLVYVISSIVLGQHRVNPFLGGGQAENQGQRSKQVLAPQDKVTVTTPGDENYQTKSKPGVAQGLEWLHDLKDSPDIRFPLRYTRRQIVIRSVPTRQHSSLIRVEQPLLPKFQQFDSFDKAVFAPSKSFGPLLVEVPVAPKPDASHILLGSASTVERLEGSIPFFQRWLAHTGARLIVVVVGPDDTAPDRQTIADLEMRMRGLGMEVTLVEPLSKEDGYIDRYFSLVKILYDHKDEKTQWLGFFDDDTFIVSMTYLVEKLSILDHKRPFYVGQLSEEWRTVIHYGVIAMGTFNAPTMRTTANFLVTESFFFLNKLIPDFFVGGGGIFFSIPMAEVVVANYDDCKKHASKDGGDQMLGDCVAMYSNTRLTPIGGLYQIDIHGDRSGIFESGRIILSLHHWKEGFWSEDGEGPDGIRHPRWFPMDKMALVQEVCGDTSFLQRFLFGNDTILTNGYSIANYPTGALDTLPVGKVTKSPDGKLVSLDQVERTWASGPAVEKSANDGYDHYLGTCRPALKLEKDKIHWRLMEATLEKDGGVRQYFRRVGRNGRIDEWVELHFTKEK